MGVSNLINRISSINSIGQSKFLPTHPVLPNYHQNRCQDRPPYPEGRLENLLSIVLRIILRIRGVSGVSGRALHLADYQRLPRCLYDPLRQYNARIDLEDSFYLG